MHWDRHSGYSAHMKPFFILLALPFALEAAPALDSKTLPLVPRYELAAGQVLKTRRTVDDKRGQPTQFAVGVPTDLRLSEGRWDERDANTARWRLRLHSADALSLNLKLADVKLPPGAELWLYDIDGRVAQGPYTHKQVSKNRQLWTAIAKGEEAVLELNVAKSDVGQVALRVVEVNHGFKDVVGASAKSGSCNIDVACPESDSWRDEVRSVARITIGGQFLCTGQLINNVRQDLTPYFITADHCRIEADPSTAADSVVFYWNYQTSACGGNPDGSLAQTQSGSTFIADDSRSDFTLVQLNQAPLPAYGVYYAGWNVGSTAPASGVSLHHPSGNEKRISVFDSAATASDVIVDGVPVSGWQVRWDHGVTEPGSSGGGLWDQNKLMVGVLSGGDSSCSNPGGSDYYGRLNVAWTASPSSSGQLKAHLDPDNSGNTTQAGRDPAVPLTTSRSSSGVLLGGGALDGFTLLTLLLFAAPWRLRRAQMRGEKNRG